MDPVQTKDVDNLVRMVETIHKHNQQNGAGAVIGRAIAGMIFTMVDQAEGREPRPAASPNVTQLAETIFKDFSQTLRALGLELVQNRGASDVAALNDQRKQASGKAHTLETDRIAFEVYDANKLQRFFRDLSPRQVERPEVQGAILFVTKALDEEFVHKYLRACVNPDLARAWQELVDPLMEVSSDLRRLGLTAAADTTVHHLDRALQGDLKEFLLAEEYNLLTPSGFGPHLWHTDSTAENFKQRWDEILEVAGTIGMNPKAQDLYKRVHSFLTQSAEVAMRDITTELSRGEKADSEWRTYGPSKIETLKEVQTELAVAKPNSFEP